MNKKKVLLVDDELDFLEIMRPRIRSWGYEILVASDSAAAIDVFKSEKPDAVILDYVMPDMDGIQLLKKIRAIDKKIPVIMFTARPNPDAIEDAINLNITAFIPKISPYVDTQASLKSSLDMVLKKS